MNQKTNKQINLSWKDIEEYTKLLSKKIKKSKFVPDYIICIMRGGMILSRMLSDQLEVKEILPFLISSYTKDNKRGGLIITEFEYSFITGKKVLICDEIVDSGETLETVIKMVNKHKPSEMKTVALLLKDGCKIIPDFYVYKESKQKWINFPWEINNKGEKMIKCFECNKGSCKDENIGVLCGIKERLKYLIKKESPLTVKYDKGLLTISVGINRLQGNENHPTIPELQIDYPNTWADDIIAELEREDEQGRNLLTEMFDSAIQNAIDNGSIAINNRVYDNEIKKRKNYNEK